MAADIDRVAASELGDLLPLVRAGERLTRGDCMRLWRTDDLTSLGVLANHARERASGNRTQYHCAVHINYTGNPVPACPECTAVSAARHSKVSPAELAGLLEGIDGARIHELHLTGGPDLEMGVDGLCRMMERASAACPALSIRAFTWQELECAAAIEGRTPSRTLPSLVDAGLTSIAGGALVDLSPSVFHLGPESIHKMEARMPWIQAAADLGLKSDLSWIIGDGDDPEVLTDMLVCIRGIQDHWAVFESFAPLAFQWPPEALELPMPTGYNHLRAVAIGRLFLDNIPRIRSAPFAVSEPLAQVAQWYGADDAGSACAPRDSRWSTPGIGVDRLLKLLQESGRDPVGL